MKNIDYFNMLAVFMPMLLSIVAISISVCTARKQNKIALFEKRYELYIEIKNYCELGKAMFAQFEFLNENLDDERAVDCLDEFQYIDVALNEFFEQSIFSKPKIYIEFDEIYIDKLYRASIADYFKSQAVLVEKISLLFDNKSAKVFEVYLNKIISIFIDSEKSNIVEDIKTIAEKSDNFNRNYLIKMKDKIIL